LLVGENPGTKLDQAKALGVNVIGEQDLHQIIAENTRIKS
jgi:NAD-dependent DNA ligase